MNSLTRPLPQALLCIGAGDIDWQNCKWLPVLSFAEAAAEQGMRGI